MNSDPRQLSVPLSHLVPSRNPRKVKASRQAHETLVALIRAYGLLQPLVVRPLEGKAKHFEVVAGHRRLSALREIHKGDGDPKIPCLLHNVDNITAGAVSLGENFGREAMHPLDEAEEFARLASEKGKGVEVIAADFGVPERYVKQRMKLAGLASVIKAAFRAGEIDTATAEAFASVPPDRQMQVWKEVNGQPRHADHVHRMISNDWIDARSASFDLSTLPESAVSRDLFSDRVLIERKAFMEAQAQALSAEQGRLAEEGWSQVVVQPYAEVQDRLLSMTQAPPEFDEQITVKLKKLTEMRGKLESKLQELEESDQRGLETIQLKYEELDDQERTLTKDAKVHYSEATKAIGTAFLMLDPDGRVRREYRMPRGRASGADNGKGTETSSETVKPPALDDLSANQLATTFAHQAIAVRHALLQNTSVRKRVLALILHEKIRCEALSIRHETNGTTVHADRTDGFSSKALDLLRQRRRELDPLHNQQHVEDHRAYAALAKLSARKLDALIDLLIVDCINAHPLRRTTLVFQLADELKVNVRDCWRPDAAWLASYQKTQLSALVMVLKGKVHAPAPERKKSELVELLAKLFADAAEGKLEDKPLADRVNRWLPSNLRDEKEDGKKQAASSDRE